MTRDVREIQALCEETLRRNWREGVRQRDGASFAYTRPSPDHYPFQWYWDSCFAAVVWRRFDPARARAELESLLAAQDEDGFIGHTIFWDTPLSRRQRLTYNVITADAPMTASIQPPALAWAWRTAVGDPATVPAIAHHHDWLSRHRDLDGDGLIWIVQPDESGLDASPQFDAIWRGHADGLPGFVLLVRRNRALRYDLRRILDAGGPVCCEVLTNVLHALSLLALGRPSLTGTIVERMYDEEVGLFRPTGATATGQRADRDLGRALATGPSGPARGDRQAAGGGASARCRAILAARSAALGAGRRSVLLAAEVDARDQALLARPHVGQRRLARLVGPCTPRLRVRGRDPRART